MADKVSLNVSITRKAYVQLCAHTAAMRGTADGSPGKVVDRLILENLRAFRVSRHGEESGEGIPEERA